MRYRELTLSVLYACLIGALNKGSIRNNYSFSSLKPYVVTPHLNYLVETVQVKGHNICFKQKVSLIIIKYSLLSIALALTSNLTANL